MSNLQVTREKLPTGTAEPQISGFFSKLLEPFRSKIGVYPLISVKKP
jgi:hypothetical protein